MDKRISVRNNKVKYFVKNEILMQFHSSGILVKPDCIQHPDIQLVLYICLFSINCIQHPDIQLDLDICLFSMQKCILKHTVSLYCVWYIFFFIGHPVSNPNLYQVFNCIHWTPRYPALNFLLVYNSILGTPCIQDYIEPKT